MTEQETNPITKEQEQNAPTPEGVAAPENAPAQNGQAPSFGDLGLSAPVMEAVATFGFDTPTPVQAAAIPEGVAGHDVMAAAQTGTGKTLAYLLPIYDRMVRHWQGKRPKGAKGPYALVLSPTRELATQIAEAAAKISETTGFRVRNIIGGKRYDKQIEGLKKGCDILIATPGRLLDLLNQNALQLGNVHYLVLDEVDRMMDMGFWPSVSTIIRQVEGEHQTFFFSATLTKPVLAKAETLHLDPVVIEINHVGETANTVKEYVMPVAQSQKLDLLLTLLQQEGPERVLIFTQTKQEADSCTRRLQGAGIKADSIHSDKHQSKRDKALRDFRNGKTDVLVATDVLARGIDITGVNYVVNYTVPKTPEDYVHRIGRTGRAGVDGVAYTFFTPDQLLDLREIEYFTHNRLEQRDLEGFAYSDNRLVPDPKRPTKRITRRGRKRPGFRR